MLDRERYQIRLYPPFLVLKYNTNSMLKLQTFLTRFNQTIPCSQLSQSFTLSSYQANKNTKQLNDVSVGHRVEPANEGVEHCDTGRQHHGLGERHVQDDGQGGAWV